MKEAVVAIARSVVQHGAAFASAMLLEWRPIAVTSGQPPVLPWHEDEWMQRFVRQHGFVVAILEFILQTTFFRSLVIAVPLEDEIINSKVGSGLTRVIFFAHSPLL
jgi:hypothetical protein